MRVAVLVIAGCGRFGFHDDRDGGNGVGDGTSVVDAAPLVACGVTASAGFATGSVSAQGGWAGAAMYDETVEAGAFAHLGQQAWRVTNQVTAQSFGDMPLGFALAETAGESTVRSAGGGDSMEMIVWLRSVNASADGSSLVVHMSPPSGDRQTYVRITNHLDSAGGLQLDVYDYVSGGSGRRIVFATGLARATWFELRMVMQTPDGNQNDSFDIWRDGQYVARYGTWEGYFYQVPPIIAVNRLMVRLATPPSTFDPSFTDTGAQGFYLDDVCYRVYRSVDPEPSVAAYYTSFEP